jgi:ReqiPepy6 Gp37-like protein
MAATYNILLFSPFGVAFGDLNAFESFEAALVENDVGALTITLPPSYRYDRFQKDGRIAVYRTIAGRPPDLLGNALWLIRSRRKTLDRGRRAIIIRAVHANDLLRRRIIAYNAGTANTSKTGAADDIIKAFAREQLTTATDTTRNVTSAIFTIQVDTTQGPSISKAATRRNLLTVCQEIANAAATAGTYTGFEVRALSEASLQLVTYIGQRGTDRRSTTAQPLLLTVDAALGRLTYSEDWSSEISSVYAGGQGEGTQRAIGTATDAGLIGSSPFGLVEDFYQDNLTSDTTQLNDDADQQLFARRSKVSFSASVDDIPGATFGIHYGWGDLVSAQFDDVSFDCRVNPVRVSFTRDQGERLDIQLRTPD